MTDGQGHAVKAVILDDATRAKIAAMCSGGCAFHCADIDALELENILSGAIRAMSPVAADAAGCLQAARPGDFQAVVKQAPDTVSLLLSMARAIARLLRHVIDNDLDKQDARILLAELKTQADEVNNGRR